jgi:hypothetical protein
MNVLREYLAAAHNAAQRRAQQLADQVDSAATPQDRANALSELREAERHVGRGDVLLRTTDSALFVDSD